MLFCDANQRVQPRISRFFFDRRVVSGGIFVVNILKHQHIPEFLFSPFRETTALDELRRVFIRDSFYFGTMTRSLTSVGPMFSTSAVS